MNTRILIGIVLVVLGIFVMISPQFLAVVVGLALIIGGLYMALQSASSNNNI